MTLPQYQCPSSAGYPHDQTFIIRAPRIESRLDRQERDNSKGKAWLVNPGGINKGLSFYVMSGGLMTSLIPVGRRGHRAARTSGAFKMRSPSLRPNRKEWLPLGR